MKRKKIEGIGRQNKKVSDFREDRFQVRPHIIQKRNGELNMHLYPTRQRETCGPRFILPIPFSLRWSRPCTSL